MFHQQLCLLHCLLKAERGRWWRVQPRGRPLEGTGMQPGRTAHSRSISRSPDSRQSDLATAEGNSAGAAEPCPRTGQAETAEDLSADIHRLTAAAGVADAMK